jgi:hypothetical protein
MSESRGHYIDSSGNGDTHHHHHHQDQSQNRGGQQQNGIVNHPVPIQIVRPQQVNVFLSFFSLL